MQGLGGVITVCWVKPHCANVREKSGYVNADTYGTLPPPLAPNLKLYKFLDSKHTHSVWVDNAASFVGVERITLATFQHSVKIFLLLLLLLLLLEALQLQRSFGLLNEFLPFGPVSDESFQFVIFILVISLFTSSSHLFLGLPSDLVSAADHSYTFLPWCYLTYYVRVRTKLIFVL